MSFEHCEMWLLGGNHFLMEEEQQKLTSQWNLKQFKVCFCHQNGGPRSGFVGGYQENLADGK